MNGQTARTIDPRNAAQMEMAINAQLAEVMRGPTVDNHPNHCEEQALTIDPANDAALDGTVYAVEPLGDRTLVDIEIGGQRIIVKAPPTATYTIGEPVRAAVDMDRVHLFDAHTEAAIAKR